jgi:hypothetical protein
LIDKKFDLQEGVILGFDDKRLHFSPDDDKSLGEDAFLIRIKPENIVMEEDLFLDSNSVLFERPSFLEWIYNERQDK